MNGNPINGSKQEGRRFFNGSGKAFFGRDYLERQRYLHRGYVQVSIENSLPTRTGNNGICNFGWCSGSYCHSCNHNIPSENPGALGRYNKWNTRSLRTRSLREFIHRGRYADRWFKLALMGKLTDKSGQSTVEYAIVSAAFIALLVGIGAFASFLQDGETVAHVVAAASHGVDASLGGITDVFSF